VTIRFYSTQIEKNVITTGYKVNRTA